jgi:hypothetical protein
VFPPLPVVPGSGAGYYRIAAAPIRLAINCRWLAPRHFIIAAENGVNPR